MKIVSIPDLKVFLEIDTDKTLQDSLLAIFDDVISKRIETWLNRNLVKASYSQYFDSGRKSYYLPAYPIDTEVALTVTLDGAVQTVDSDYRVWAPEGLIEFDAETVYTDPKEVLIAWTGGYTETPISSVLGTDGNTYRCKLTHTAAADNRPTTGANWATYWELVT